ncbi:MAG: hypothetical protein P1U56_20445 [Saprospiraceae bacterium]|nr:hypothetical protein [Saprospiraceae bacterium]
MKSTSQKELSELQEQLKHDAFNIDLMNQIALVYFENADLLNNSEDHKYLKQAYDTKRTIKSIHNYAWFLYFEWAEMHHGFSTNNPICREALEIQRGTMDLDPVSFYPYYQLGYFLLDQNKYEESLKYLKIASLKDKRKDIHHNLAYSYIRTNQYREAKSVLENIKDIEDLENTSLYNLSICNLKLRNDQDFAENLEKLYSTVESMVHKTVSGYEIAQLHTAMGNYNSALNCITKQGIQSIELLDWPVLSYAIYQSDKNLWLEEMNRLIEWRINLIQEFKEGDEEDDGYTDNERKERILVLSDEIQQIQTSIKFEPQKPNIELNKLSIKDYCGCLLFGCKTHKNLSNDK